MNPFDVRQMSKGQESDVKRQTVRINYYFLVGIFAFIIFFSIANAYEPQIDSQLDFFDISLPAAQFMTGIFGLFVAKKYDWTSHVFGRAYLALSTGFLLWGIGSTVFIILVIQGADFPYPGQPDLFFVPTYIALFFHLTTITRYFKKKFSAKDKAVLILVPVVINIVYVSAVLLQSSVPGSVPDLLSHQVVVNGQAYMLEPANGTSDVGQIMVEGTTYNLIPVESYTNYPQIPETEGVIDPVPLVLTKLEISFDPSTLTPDFWPPFFAGLFYNTISTLNLAMAILGMTVFRGSVLGSAWGVILIGLILISAADLVFDFTSIYGDVRTSMAIPLWVFGCIVLSYALHLHRKVL